MSKRWIAACFTAIAIMAVGPGSQIGRAQPQPWDVRGNDFPTAPLPIGTYQQNGGGFFTAFEYLIWQMPRTIGSQQIAVRGLVDSAGLLSGTPGAFLGSGESALATDAWGRKSYSPGYRMTVGYRFENGISFAVEWTHLFDTKYTGGASRQGPNFQNPGNNLQNNFLFSPVFNFSPDFSGSVARVTGAGGQIAFGALNGIWNGADDMTIEFLQRFDNWDFAGRFPVYETENARSYGMAGIRFSWIFERFKWRTAAIAIDPTPVPVGTPPRALQLASDAARYVNTLSQRMYGPFLGVGHEVYLGSGFGLSAEISGSLLADIAKQHAKYIRDDEFTQAKRSLTKFEFVPNVNSSLNLTWQPIQGMEVRAGWTFMNYFNTLYMESPVGFNVGAIDPAYKVKFYRYITGLNVGLGYTW